MLVQVVLFILVIYMKMNKKEEVYYCFRYRCERCPRNRICEEQRKREEEKKKEVNRMAETNNKGNGRPKTGKYDNLIKDIQEYTKKTEYPILKELCYQKHYNYDTIMKYQRDDEQLMQSIKELLYKKETYLERNGILGKLSNTMAVFTLKQLGWKDNIEVKTNAVEDLTTLADMLGFKK